MQWSEHGLTSAGFVFSGTWTTGWSSPPWRPWPIGSALALSLPGGSDKGGEVRSCPLADCKLPWYDHQYRSRQDFSCPGVGGEISVSGGEFPCFDGSPCSAMADAFGTPGVTGEVGSLGLSSNALPAVAFEEILVPRVGSSLAPSASVPGGERGSVVVDGVGPSSPRGLIQDTSYRPSHVLGRVSVGVGRSPPRSFLVRGVVGGGAVVAHQSFRDEGHVSGVAVVSGDSHRSSGDCDVRQLVDCGLLQQAGWNGVPPPLLIDRSPSQVDGES